MTAHTDIGAQTSSQVDAVKSFLSLPQEERTVQLEEAYGRATVAITRARSLCFIMGPLDMKGLRGAATEMYGAEHVWESHANFYFHEHALARAPTDQKFVQMLATICCLTGPDFPPPAIAEVLQDCVANYHKVRRLYLIVVDLWRPWRYNTRQAKAITEHFGFSKKGAIRGE